MTQSISEVSINLQHCTQKYMFHMVATFPAMLILGPCTMHLYYVPIVYQVLLYKPQKFVSSKHVTKLLAIPWTLQVKLKLTVIIIFFQTKVIPGEDKDNHNLYIEHQIL